MPRCSAYSRIASAWFSVEYCWCSVDMRTYCAARNLLGSRSPLFKTLQYRFATERLVSITSVGAALALQRRAKVSWLGSH